MLNYYGKFLPNLSTCLAPLYSLLLKRSHWSWGAEQCKAFEQTKSMLTSSSILTHYDPSKPLILACDVSPYGVGAVLSHNLDMMNCLLPLPPAPWHQPRKTIHKLTRRHLLLSGVKHFHQYLFGPLFTIKSEHKSLQHLFGEKRVFL